MLLKSPYIIICEWIPMGANQFKQFVNAVEAYMRDQKIITMAIDKKPETAIFKLAGDKAFVKILDYSPSKSISIKADIRYREAEEITQRERLGIIIRREGFIFFTTRIINAGNRNDDYVDAFSLSWIITDLFEDTSKLMHSLLTTYQKRVLEVVYPHSEKPHYDRNKVIGIIVEDLIFNGISIWELLEKKPSIEDFMSCIEFKERLQSMIGYVEKYFLEGDFVIFVGVKGILVVTKNERKIISNIKDFLTLRALDIFYASMFARIYAIWNDLREIRESLFSEVDVSNIGSLSEYRIKLSGLLSDITILWDVNELAEKEIEDLELLKDNPLITLLDLEAVKEDVKDVIMTAKSTIEAFRMDLLGIIDILGTFVEEHVRTMNESMKESLSKQTEIMEIEHSEKRRLEMLEYLSAGILIGEILRLIFEFLEEEYHIYLGGWKYLLIVILILTLAFVVRIVSKFFEGRLLKHAGIEASLRGLRSLYK